MDAAEDTGQTFEVDIVLEEWGYRRVPEAIWADHVENASNGRIKVNRLSREAIAPSASDVIELVRSGEIQVGSSGESAIAGFFPEIQVIGIPFIMPNPIVGTEVLAYESPFYQRVAEGFYNATNGEARIVGAFVNSLRQLYSNEPIRVPSDLERYGTKIRLKQSPLNIAVWEAFGASAIGLPPAERYMALETGLIDALEGGVNSVYSIGAFELIDYATLINYQYSANFMMVNEQWYQSLPAELRTIVNDGFIKARWTTSPTRMWGDFEQVEVLTQEGNTVIIPTNAEMAQWSEIAVPIAKEFLADQIDTNWIDYLQADIDRVVAEMTAAHGVIGAQY